MPLFGPFLSLNNRSQASESIVNRFVVGKIFGHIGINNDNVGAFRISVCVFSLYAACKIVFL